MGDDAGNPPPFYQALFRDKGFLNESAQVESKALISEITGTIPSFRWTYVPERLIRNLTLASYELAQLAQTDVPMIEASTDAILKYAFTWEALAHTREKTGSRTAFLNAALAYELAGYQANAACLARSLLSDEPDSPSGELLSATSLFLQRRLLKLILLARTLMSEPKTKPNLDQDYPELIALAISARGLAAACEGLMSGKGDSFGQASTYLLTAEKLWAALGLVGEANIVGRLRALLPVVRSRSTWAILHPILPQNPRWARYLKLLSRGVGPEAINEPVGI